MWFLFSSWKIRLPCKTTSRRSSSTSGSSTSTLSQSLPTKHFQAIFTLKTLNRFQRFDHLTFASGPIRIFSQFLLDAHSRSFQDHAVCIRNGFALCVPWSPTHIHSPGIMKDLDTVLCLFSFKIMLFILFESCFLEIIYFYLGWVFCWNSILLLYPLGII